MGLVFYYIMTGKNLIDRTPTNFEFFDDIESQVKDPLLKRMLQFNPDGRPTLLEVCQDPSLTQYHIPIVIRATNPTLPTTEDAAWPHIVDVIKSLLLSKYFYEPVPAMAFFISCGVAVQCLSLDLKPDILTTSAARIGAVLSGVDASWSNLFALYDNDELNDADVAIINHLEGHLFWPGMWLTATSGQQVREAAANIVNISTMLQPLTATGNESKLMSTEELLQ